MIRLHAAFDVEEENKATMVTFDGNGGVTNDTAAQERVTEAVAVNKDFLMKDGESFVREGYDLIGWAFQRDDGSKITPEAYKSAVASLTAEQLIEAGIYQLGQKVAADNKLISGENNWDPLENTVYAVWEPKKYTVTVKKLVEGEETADKQFGFTVAAEGSFVLSQEDASFNLENQ